MPVVIILPIILVCIGIYVIGKSKGYIEGYNDGIEHYKKIISDHNHHQT